MEWKLYNSWSLTRMATSLGTEWVSWQREQGFIFYQWFTDSHGNLSQLKAGSSGVVLHKPHDLQRSQLQQLLSGTDNPNLSTQKQNHCRACGTVTPLFKPQTAGLERSTQCMRNTVTSLITFRFVHIQICLVRKITRACHCVNTISISTIWPAVYQPTKGWKVGWQA